jgi:alpha-tubulin suppressor-like RCC1 family protein
MRKWLTRCAVAAALILLVLLVGMHQIHAPPISMDKPLPQGKVRPQLVSSGDMALLLAPDGSLWAWGRALTNVFPQPTNSPVPLRLGSDSDWAQVACGTGHTVALKTDGSLWAWGWNSYGEVGQPLGKHTPVRIGTVWVSGTYVQRRQDNSNYTPTGSAPILQYKAGPKAVFAEPYGTPTRIGTGTNWRKISAGFNYNLALKTDGSLWAWGCNELGQLGDGSRSNQYVPTMIGTNRDWRTIAASTWTGFGIKSDGTLWAWGNGGFGLAPEQLGSDTDWLSISAYESTVIALKASGTLWVSGKNFDSGSAISPSPNFKQIGRDSDWSQAYAGQSSFFARKKDASWWVCGRNAWGQLGLGTSIYEASSPQLLPFNFEPWAFAPGTRTTLLLGKDGKLWTWGFRQEAGNQSGGSWRWKTFEFLAPVMERDQPTLHRILFKSNCDEKPYLLWKLPAEVRVSLGIGSRSSTNELPASPPP